MAKRKRGIENNSFMEEYVGFYGGKVFRTVYNSIGGRVYDLPVEVLQQQTRDLMEALQYRWNHYIPCGSLIPSTIRVRDNVAMLPDVDLSDTIQYPLILQEHVEAVYGTTGSRKDRDDFLAKLRTPGLTRRQFEALYYHQFLQNQEQRTDFPADVVENLRDQWVPYEGTLMHWENAYFFWEQKKYNQKFKLYDTCSQHPYHYGALKVYLHGTYLDNSVNQVKLARNIIRHINDHMWKAQMHLYNKREKSAIIYELFPCVGSRLFEFLWELGINLDFKKSKKYLRAKSAAKFWTPKGHGGRMLFIASFSGAHFKLTQLLTLDSFRNEPNGGSSNVSVSGKLIGTVPESITFMIERFGKYHMTLHSGIPFLIPLVNKTAVVHSLKEEVFNVPNQSAVSQDNITIQIDGVIYLKIMDPFLASYRHVSPFDASIQLSQGGITPPDKVRQSMEMQADAERRKRVTVLVSQEGEKQAALFAAEGSYNSDISVAERMQHLKEFPL